MLQASSSGKMKSTHSKDLPPPPRLQLRTQGEYMDLLSEYFANWTLVRDWGRKLDQSSCVFSGYGSFYSLPPECEPCSPHPESALSAGILSAPEEGEREALMGDGVRCPECSWCLCFLSLPPGPQQATGQKLQLHLKPLGVNSWNSEGEESSQPRRARVPRPGVRNTSASSPSLFSFCLHLKANPMTGNTKQIGEKKASALQASQPKDQEGKGWRLWKLGGELGDGEEEAAEKRDPRPTRLTPQLCALLIRRWRNTPRWELGKDLHWRAPKWHIWGAPARLQRAPPEDTGPQSTEATSPLEALASPAGLPAKNETKVRVKDLSSEVITIVLQFVVVSSVKWCMR